MLHHIISLAKNDATLHYLSACSRSPQPWDRSFLQEKVLWYRLPCSLWLTVVIPIKVVTTDTVVCKSQCVDRSGNVHL